MAAPWPAEIVIDQGRDWFCTVYWKEDDGTPIPLTGYTAEWCLREDYGKPVLITLTDGAGITITPLDGRVDLHMTHTQNTFSEGIYVAELVVKAGGDSAEYSILNGTIPITPKVVP